MRDAVSYFGAVPNDPSARAVNNAALQAMFDHMVNTGEAVGFTHPQTFYLAAPLSVWRSDRATQPQRWMLHANNAALSWRGTSPDTSGNDGALIRFGADSLDNALDGNGLLGAGGFTMAGQLHILGPDGSTHPVSGPAPNGHVGVYLKHLLNAEVSFAVNGVHTGLRSHMSWSNILRRCIIERCVVGAHVGYGNTIALWEAPQFKQCRTGLLIRNDGGVVTKSQTFLQPRFEDVSVAAWFDAASDRIDGIRLLDPYVEYHNEARAHDCWRIGTTYSDTVEARGGACPFALDNIVIEGGSYATFPPVAGSRALQYRQPGAAPGAVLRAPAYALGANAMQGAAGGTSLGGTLEGYREFMVQVNADHQIIAAAPEVESVQTVSTGRLRINLSVGLDPATVYVRGSGDSGDIVGVRRSTVQSTVVETQLLTNHDNFVNRPVMTFWIGGRAL